MLALNNTPFQHGRTTTKGLEERRMEGKEETKEWGSDRAKKEERKHHAAWVTNKKGTEGEKEVRSKRSRGRMTFCITRIYKRVAGEIAENSQVRAERNSKKAGTNGKGEHIFSACVGLPLGGGRLGVWRLWDGCLHPLCSPYLEDVTCPRPEAELLHWSHPLFLSSLFLF